MTNAFDDIPVYHFTHKNNLPHILNSGCLYCKAEIPSELEVVDVSLENIQESRRSKKVDCGAGGTLHDYVPFMFATRSPMMFLISKGGVEGRSNDTRDLVYLVSSVGSIRSAGLDFIFSDGHPITLLSNFYDDPSDLGNIDWPLMRERYWNDTQDDHDRSRRRQAEFLIHRKLPWEAVEYLAVKDKRAKEKLERYLKSNWPSMERFVESRPRWYF